MTWTAHFTVQDVGDGPAPIDVLLTAHCDEKVNPFKAHGGETEQAAIVSNTEGKIYSAELKLVFDEDSAPVAVGDIVSVHGHFIKKKT